MYKYQVIYVKNLFKRLLQYIMFLHFCTQFLVYQGIAVSHIPSDWHRHPSHVFTVNVQLVKHLWYQCKKKKKTYALSLFSLWLKQVAPNSNALSKRMGTEWAVVKKLFQHVVIHSFWQYNIPKVKTRSRCTCRQVNKTLKVVFHRYVWELSYTMRGHSFWHRQKTKSEKNLSFHEIEGICVKNKVSLKLLKYQESWNNAQNTINAQIEIQGLEKPDRLGIKTHVSLQCNEGKRWNDTRWIQM